MPDYNIKMIASDLDDTLLNSDKLLTERTRATLARAAARGIEFVPASGRFYDAFPEAVRSLDLVHYAIAINGAEVREVATGKVIYRSEMPLARALELMEYLDTLPVIYDCYMDGWGWMTEALQARAAEYTPNVHYLEMLMKKRTPVPDLKAFIRERGHDIQKSQFFIKNAADKPAVMAELSRRFPDLSVVSSVVNNIEVTTRAANKGDALMALADYLHIDRAATMAFGDELNDLSMIEAAGLGVAMGNAAEALKAAADAVTADCNHDGEALAIEQYCLSSKEDK